MQEEQRQREIIRIVEDQSHVSVSQLVKLLRVSEATIRRDLRRLGHARQVRRTRGGAVAVDSHEPALLWGQPGHDIERERHVAAKRAIGRRAASFCRPGQSLILGCGTTTAEMATFLPPEGLQILTGSLAVLETINRNTRNRVFVPGGEIVREQRVILAAARDPALEAHYAATLYMGVQGISARGYLQTDPELVKTQRRYVSIAERVVVLADSSKFMGEGRLPVCGLDGVDMVVTDSRVQPDQVTMLREAGVEVVVVAVEETSVA